MIKFHLLVILNPIRVEFHFILVILNPINIEFHFLFTRHSINHLNFLFLTFYFINLDHYLNCSMIHLITIQIPIVNHFIINCLKTINHFQEYLISRLDKAHHPFSYQNLQIIINLFLYYYHHHLLNISAYVLA